MAPTSMRQTSVPVRETKIRQQSIDDLPQQHAIILTRAIFNVLSTPAARLTYAQIIDGAPINQVVEAIAGPSSWLYPVNHPLRTHVELCPGALDQSKNTCSTFDLKSLGFDTQLLRAFSSAMPDSKEFETRLVEMVAVGIHQIAIYLYKLNIDLGNHKDLAAWVPPNNNRVRYLFYPDGKLPTIFVHGQYRDFSQYPHGVADMVGYWAEAEVFGGVVVFDRRKPNKRGLHPDLTKSDAIFFHSNRRRVTYRIWKLLGTQREALLRFLLSNPETQDAAPNPFPIQADSSNITRIDPEEPVHKTGIYRDLWERKPLGDNDPDSRSGCCFNETDYTSREEFMETKERYWARRQEIQDRFEAEVDEEIAAEELEKASKEMDFADFDDSE